MLWLYILKNPYNQKLIKIMGMLSWTEHLINNNNSIEMFINFIWQLWAKAALQTILQVSDTLNKPIFIVQNRLCYFL